MLRDWGQEKRYHHVLKGFNYRMEGIQGAILRVKLRHLEAWTEARRARAREYDALLAGLRRRDARASCPDAGTSITSTPCARRTATALQRTAAGEGRRRPASTIRFRCTCSRRTPTSGYKAGDFPQSEARPAKCCRCRCSPR